MAYKTYLEVEIEVDYDFQPEEKQVLYPNDEAYPGCPAEVTINGIWVGLKDISENIDRDTIEIIKAEIMEFEMQPPEEF